MTAAAARSPAADKSAAELIERFREALERLLPDGERFGLAVSGGPDSVAMLLLAQAAVPDRFEVATVNHGLRPEAAQECELVARHCKARGLPCTILEVQVAPGNVQERAREARYAALAEWARGRGLGAVATAHHADDQAETLLMRLNRGSGVAGLAGVREQAVWDGSNAGLRVIRPLLGFRRSELAEVVAGVEVARDPSNEDVRFDRVRIRKALADTPWLDPPTVARSAAHLADAEEALQWATDRAWSEHVTIGQDSLRFRPGLPREITMRIVSRAVGAFGDIARGKDVARLIERLEGGKGGNLAGVLVTVEDDEWVFRREPARRAG